MESFKASTPETRANTGGPTWQLFGMVAKEDQSELIEVLLLRSRLWMLKESLKL